MRTRHLFLVVSLLIALIGCNRDPNAAKQKYLESGNRYFDNGRYKQASIMYRKALTKDARFGEAHYRLGLSELKLDNRPGAARAFRRAVELQPENEDAAAKLGNLYMEAYAGTARRPVGYLTDIRELADEKRGLLKRNPRSYDGLRLMGFVAMFEKDLPTALERFKLANEVKPHQSELVVAYVQALNASQRWEEGEKLALAQIEKQPTFAAIYDVLYMEYIKRGRVADAEAVLRRKAENNPKRADFLLQLAAHYRAAKKEAQVTETLNSIISRPADFPDAHLHVGDYYSLAKDIDRAIHHYQEGLRTAGDEKKPNYHKRLLIAYMVQDKTNEARELIDTMLKANPKDAQALAMRASLTLRTGDRAQLKAAINDLNAAATQQPLNFVVRYDLGRAHLAQNEIEVARGHFQEAIKLRGDYIAPRLALARIHLARGEFAKSLQIAGDVLSLSPNDLSAKLIRTRSLMSTGDLKQARTELEALIKAKPDATDAQLQLATLNFSERRFKEAEAIFRKLNETNPADPRGFLGLVEAQMSQGRTEEALSALQAAADKAPDRQDYRLALADVSARAEKYDVAIQQYQRLLAANPKAREVQVRLAETYRRKGDVQNAIQHFSKARDMAPNDPMTSVQLAMLLGESGQWSLAKPIYEQVLKVDPDNPYALNNLAFILAENGSDLDQALTLAQRAKQKVPQNPDIADTLGWIYIKKNLSDNAISIFRELTAKHAASPTYHYHLGMALYQKGDKPQARKALETALRNKPKKDEEGKIRELMARIG